MVRVFTLDGVEFDVFVKSIKRSFAVTDTDNSGRTMDGNMHRDIIGTYYNYTLDIDTENLNTTDYDLLYEMISAPVESHTLTVPYGQDTLTFKAYVTKGEDNLKVRKVIKRGSNSVEYKHIWSGLSINFIATEPQRRP